MTDIPTTFPPARIIDSHHHFWQLDRFPYKWLSPNAGPARFGDKAKIRRDYLPPDYVSEMSCVNLVGSVHVQANSGATDPVEETLWLDALGKETGWPSAIVAEVDLSEPSAEDLIARHLASSRLRGVRTPVAWDDEGRWRVASKPRVLENSDFRRAAKMLIDADLVLDMVVVPQQLPEVADLSKSLPDLRIAINHFATLEPAQPENAENWYAGIDAVADRPNIFLKLSGLWTADPQWAPDVLGPFVSYAVKRLSPARLMYGSNLPVERVNCSLPQQINSLAALLKNQPQEDLDAIFHNTARSVYRLT